MKYPDDDIPELTPGTEIQNYRIVERLDIDAGLCRSYLAEHRLFARKVVITHVSFATDTRARFARWLTFIEQLRHPRIIGLLDCGEYGEFPYAVVPYVEARTLAQVISAGQRFDVLTVLRLFWLIADTLAYCHRLGIAHRDMKLEHVLLSAEGIPYLKGFEGAAGLRDPIDRRGFTWTPSCSPPEVWGHVERLLNRDSFPSESESFAVSDVWSFGLMMFIAISGDMSIRSLEIEAARKLICSPEPFDLGSLRNSVPPPVVRFIERCLEKNPVDRYPDAIALEEALGALLAHVSVESSEFGQISVEAGRGLLVFAEPLDASASGRYLELRVIQRLGSGAFADVFKTERILPGPAGTAPLALKVLKRERASNADSVERFRREAVFLSRVNHPNVVKIHAFGRLGVSFFILEELIDGVALEEYLRAESRLGCRRASCIAAQIAAGLEAMHSVGLIHRDLKPENIMLTKNAERVVIADFGIAHASNATRFTETGVFVGTPAYAAPEQLCGSAISAQTDIYALGVILYEMLSGERPHNEDFFPALRRARIFDSPVDIRILAPELPAVVCDFVMQLIARDPNDRPRSAAAVRALLEGPCFDID